VIDGAGSARVFPSAAARSFDQDWPPSPRSVPNPSLLTGTFSRACRRPPGAFSLLSDVSRAYTSPNAPTLQNW